MIRIGNFKREKPKKKWNKVEELQILDFLIKEPDFEYPTAQIFYRKFLKRSNIDATWDILRWKVRHLRVTYQKAESWRNSIDAGLLESASGPSAVQEKVLKMCSHYVKLNKIFGSQLDDSQCFQAVDIKKFEKPDIGFEAVDVASSDIPDFVDTSQPENVSVNDFEFDEDSTNQQMTDTEESNTFPTPVSSTSRRETDQITTNTKSINSPIPLSEDALLQRERTELDKSRFEFERWKTEQELELRREELAVRREELQVKRMEIEKDERVAMFEIEMKYKK